MENIENFKYVYLRVFSLMVGEVGQGIGVGTSIPIESVSVCHLSRALHAAHTMLLLPKEQRVVQGQPQNEYTLI